MTECDILKWAAGACWELPELEGARDERLLTLLGIDEERLVSLLARHRLANRFLARVQQERPAWCTRFLMANMLAQKATALRQTQRQIALMQEMTQALAAPSLPLIPIKGFTAYALTGNPAHIRWGEDLDLFFCDLERLNETLLHLGFSERLTFRFNQFALVSCDDLDCDDARLAPEVNGQHEYAKLACEDGKVEIHGYFPMFTYPEGVAQTDLLPANHPGRWTQTFPNTVARGILYKDLLATAVPGATPETREMRIPEPAISVLIRCAHIFAHYVVVGPFEDWMALKLVELAEIRDIAQDSRFSPSRFQTLLQKFGGQDAVNLSDYLLRAYLGSDALAFAAAPSPLGKSGHFPRFFQWWRGWAIYYTPETIDQLLLPASIDAMTAHLGVNTIEVTEGKPSPLYGAGADEQTRPLERVIVHSPDGKEIPFRFFVTLAAEELHFDVEILEGLPDEKFQYDFEILGKNTLERGYLHFLGTDSAGWNADGSHRSHRSYPWQDTSRPFFALLMLGLQDTRKDFFFSTDAAALAPLKIVLAP